ncbi:MAG: M17 family metallopeptidase [Phycisphaerales bacterium]
MFTAVSAANRLTPEAIVLGVFQSKSAAEPLDSKTKSLAAGLGLTAAANAAHTRKSFTAALGTTSEAPIESTRASKSRNTADRVILLGLGSKDALTLESFRTAIAGLARALAASKATAVQLELDSALASIKSIDTFDFAQAAGESLGLIAWTCDEFRGTATPKPDRTRLALRASDADFNEGLARGLALAESANIARTLSQTPPNVATPAWIADQAKKMARKTGLKCHVFEGAALTREKFEGLINVGKASENKPRMIRLEYTPKGGAKGKNAKPIVLVGKTMTYDTGGLSLKVNNGMVGMKRDKDGGCSVFGAMHAIATVIKPRRKVVAFLAAAENSVSDEAYRPDDVLTFRNGVTVEVTNTDAEGRLVLADALCYACDKENPAAIIDLATLTGGVVVALGSTFAGMWCDNDALRAQVESAAAASGERVWRLPLHQEYRDMMKSPIADIVNSNPNRKAHPIQGAAFLANFVDEKVPWCHLDIAGVHAADAPIGPFITGPTGWGVRLLANLIDNA